MKTRASCQTLVWSNTPLMTLAQILLHRCRQIHIPRSILQNTGCILDKYAQPAFSSVPKLKPSPLAQNIRPPNVLLAEVERICHTQLTFSMNMGDRLLQFARETQWCVTAQTHPCYMHNTLYRIHLSPAQFLWTAQAYATNRTRDPPGPNHQHIFSPLLKTPSISPVPCDARDHGLSAATRRITP